MARGIPITVGVTGHRDPRPEDIPALRALIHGELEKIKKLCPDSELVLLDSIAAGGDSLCAEEALSLGYRLLCPLPFALEEYRKDFSETEIGTFEHLLASADKVFVSPALEPPREDRNFLYRQAGLFVASHCHVLLSLYDGGEPAGFGCGAAEVTAFKRSGCCLDAGTLTDDPGAVIQIVTPRMKNAVNPEITVRYLENEPGQLEKILKTTDRFNREAGTVTPEYSPEPLLPEEYLREGCLKDLSDVYIAADGLACHFQKRYLRVMRGFALTGVLLVLFFLLYDTGEMSFFLLGYIILLVLYLITYLIVKKSDAHGKYLNCRLLAEISRVQLFLSAEDVEKNIGDMLTWTQKHESAWIKSAMDALTADGSALRPAEKGIIRQHWLEKELNYHRQAKKRNGKKHLLNEKGARILLILSIILTLTLRIMEYTSTDLMEKPLLSIVLPAFLQQHPGQTFTVRSLFKFLMGNVSAVTVFLSGYYGRLSLSRKTSDHHKMERLFSLALKQYDEATADRKQLLLDLAREEIIENGNWHSYCRENPPSFDL